MKIATYNVWNNEWESEAERELRIRQLLQVIRKTDADIIGLQEVWTEFYENYLVPESGYPYHVFEKYEGEEEGLAILSRYPLETSEVFYKKRDYANSQALYVSLETEGIRYSLMNVHLPWDSIRTRENQIVAIDRYLHESEADFSILLGDFNSDSGSSVDRFLSGDQTLNGEESKPCWNDLASAYSARTGVPVRATLDTVNNPRWAESKSIYTPEVMDRIYIRDHWYETELESVQIFGEEISGVTKVSASDHYGVLAEIKFRK